MENLSTWLRTAREARGLTFRDVEAAIRIRVRYLEALEAGDYDVMPGGEPQVRGFLRRYASFLGLSPEEAISRYEQELYGGRPEPAPVARPIPQPAGLTPSPERAAAPFPWRWLQVIGVVGVVALLVLVSVWLLGRSSLPGGRETTPAATTPILEGLSPLPPVTTPVAPAQTAAPQATPTFPVAAGGGITLTLEPLEHVWVRVAVDGFVAFEGILSPENPQSWAGEELVVVETGNEAGLIVVVNGQPLGTLCGRGEVCARGWGPEGEVRVPPPSESP